MKRNKTVYKVPELRVKVMGEELMGLVVPVSQGEVDDEAAKDRREDNFSDDNWGKVDNSLW